MIIAIDFDGTCVTHKYPKIGEDIGAISVLKALIARGHQLILWTMRGNKPTDEVNTLQEAVDWFVRNDIPLWGINVNPTQQENGWSNSNKQYANLYIDDAALGCPLIFGEYEERPFVDWNKVEELLKEQMIL